MLKLEDLLERVSMSRDMSIVWMRNIEGTWEDHDQLYLTHEVEKKKKNLYFVPFGLKQCPGSVRYSR